MKKIVMFGVLALTASLCADGELVADAQMNGQSQNQMNDHHKMKNGQSQKQMNDNSMMMNMVTLTSARPESENGWYVFADALYWHVDVGSTDWANVNDITVPTTTQAHNHSLNFKWDWGFRVGIGANIDHDMWDTNFYYTWLFAKNSNKAGKANTVVVDQIGIGNIDVIGDNTALTTGSINWSVHFSMFDWELGRWHYVSKNLALRPHVGVKGGWINQKIHTKFSNPRFITTQITTPGIFVSEKFENNYWGVGPSVGVNTMWVLGNAGKAMDHRFSLFGDFGGALMYGHFDIDSKQKQLNASGVQVGGINQKGLDRNLATAMLQGILGLSWDTSFNRGNNHFMFKIGYELQYWFRQNQLVKSFATGVHGILNDNLRIADDLSLQGLTGELRFDF